MRTIEQLKGIIVGLEMENEYLQRQAIEAGETEKKAYKMLNDLELFLKHWGIKHSVEERRDGKSIYIDMQHLFKRHPK